MSESSNGGVIQVYFKPVVPIPISEVRIGLYDNDFANLLTAEDDAVIEKVWSEVVREKGGKVFSKPKGLGTLYDTQDGVFTFRPTEFKVYLATTLTCDQRSLNPAVYNQMKVGAVGAVVRLGDGTVFVHQRSANATHGKNVLDSSVAGVGFTDETGKPNFQKSLYEKLAREMKIMPEEVSRVAVTGFHHASAPDFSGMLTCVVETPLESGHIEERIKDSSFEEHHFVPEDNLADFIFRHYGEGNDMIPDGCATLMASLDARIYEQLRYELRRLGRKITFGTLVAGHFNRRKV